MLVFRNKFNNSRSIYDMFQNELLFFNLNKCLPTDSVRKQFILGETFSFNNILVN
jgi:hypothetical protein